MRKKEGIFLVIIGRRRVGKTRLIQEFIKNERNTLYLFAGEKRAEALLEEWSSEIDLELKLSKAGGHFSGMF